MFDLGFFKGQPTEYIIKYSSGRIVRQGPGLAFWYFRHSTQIAAVPTSSIDASFVFNEFTNNFQAVTIQGTCTFRISDPLQAASLLNFGLDPRRHVRLGDGPERLPQRITNIVQTQTRGQIQKLTLEQTLGQSEAIALQVAEQVRESGALEPLGVELLSIFFVSAKPTPEVAKALEATYRETLLRRADEAIYARRAAAVDEERKIKESEQRTEIALEERRRQLIALQGENAQQEADFRGRALELEAQYSARAKEMELAAYRTLDPRTILSLAMQEIGHNSARIGNLTITSEVLSALLNNPPGAPEG